MLRGWCDRLQGFRSAQLSLLVLCCLLFMGLALTTLTQPSAAHTITSSVSHSATHRPDCHTLKASSDPNAANLHHTDQPDTHQHHSNQHNTNLATACCAWICSAHAVLPNMLTAVFQPIQRVLLGPFSVTRIQNPQLAHGRLIERPPRLFT